MKNVDVLSRTEINNIKDLDKLNRLIKQYEGELNRRMRILQKYAETDEALYRQGMRTFAALANKPGFAFAKIETAETQNIIVARARLANLASALTSGNTQIRSLRKNARQAKIKRENELYETLNRGKKRVTKKQIAALTSEDWREIRDLLDEYGQYDSGSVIDTYILNQEDLDEIAEEKIAKTAIERQSGASSDLLDW